MASFETVAKIIGVLKMAYPHFGSHLTREDWIALPQVYHRILSDIPDAQLEAAALQVASRNIFFPSAAELREAAFVLANHNQLSAEEAWGEVRKAMQKFGSYRIPEFDHERVARAVDVMGWRNLCMSENEITDRAHFMRVYSSLSERDKREGAMLPEVRRLIAGVAGRLALKAGRE